MANEVGAVLQKNQNQAGVVKAPPKDEADLQARTKGWMDFLTRPEIQAALVQFGMNATQPVAPGQTQLGHITSALGAGFQAAGRVETQQFLRKQEEIKTEQAAKRLEQGDKQLAQGDAQLAQGDKRLAQEAAQQGTAAKLKEQELKQQAERDANTAQYNQGMLGVQQQQAQTQAEQAAAMAGYYGAQTENLQAGGAQGVIIQQTAAAIRAANPTLTPEQAYLIAQQHVARLGTNANSGAAAAAGFARTAAALRKQAQEARVMAQDYEGDAAKPYLDNAAQLEQQAANWEAQAAALMGNPGTTGTPGTPAPGAAPSGQPSGAPSATPSGLPKLPEGYSYGPVQTSASGRKFRYVLDKNGQQSPDKQGRPRVVFEGTSAPVKK